LLTLDHCRQCTQVLSHKLDLTVQFSLSMSPSPHVMVRICRTSGRTASVHSYAVIGCLATMNALRFATSRNERSQSCVSICLLPYVSAGGSHTCRHRYVSRIAAQRGGRSISRHHSRCRWRCSTAPLSSAQGIYSSVRLFIAHTSGVSVALIVATHLPPWHYKLGGIACILSVLFVPIHQKFFVCPCFIRQVAEGE
jgi:hypothetical protein